MSKLEQVWKNVIGNTFYYDVDGEEILFVVPRGDRFTMEEFGKELCRVEDSLGSKLNIVAEVTEEGLLAIAVSVKEGTANEEETSESTSAKSEQESAEQEEIVEATAKTRKRKE